MNIFNQEPTQEPTNPSVASTNVEGSAPTPEVKPDPFADLLGTVINDKGEPKYASTPEALKGLAHSQQHIKNLEGELAQYKAELGKRKAVEDALKEFTHKPEPEVTPTQGLTEEAVADLVQQRLTEIERSKTVESNTKKVVDVIQSKFGDKAEEAFYGKAKELGMTKEQFNSLAAQSPDAVLAFFNVATQPASTPGSSINTAALRDEKKPIPTIIDGGEERIYLPRGEKSLLIGATDQDKLAELQRHKAAVYEKYGLTL